jgi:hypothetical protein
MSDKKQVKEDDKEQSARFRKDAEQVLSDDAEQLFDGAMNKILKIPQSDKNEKCVKE